MFNRGFKGMLGWSNFVCLLCGLLGVQQCSAVRAQTPLRETPRASALPANVRQRLSEERQKHQSEYDKTLATMKMLREHWHRWASLHKDDLRKLVHAKDTDFPTLERVYELLPTTLSTAEASGITKEELLLNPLRFSWQPYAKLGKTAHVKNSLQQKQRDASTKYIDTHLHEMFIERRDIELSWSHPIAGHCLVLWASGKITDCEMLGRSSVGDHKPTYDHTELVPMFDELR